jgi:hypothetical protein
MAKKASPKGETGGAKKSPRKKPASSGSRSVARASSSGSRRESGSAGTPTDIVDALIKLLQSPLVIDLLAVGATAALAAITEQRSSPSQGGAGNSKKALKAAGKAAAAAVGRRLSTEFEEIKNASKRGGDQRKTKAGAEA